MSKAFTKDDGSGTPLLVPPRAHLPPGTPNYVTTRGLTLLRQERDHLHAARAVAEGPAEEADQSPEHAVLVARIADITARIATARLVKLSEGGQEAVRFGARVTVRSESGEERRYQIVGVDEADAGQGAIAFTSPLARALMGKGWGDVVRVRAPVGIETLEVIDISYDIG